MTFDEWLASGKTEFLPALLSLDERLIARAAFEAGAAQEREACAKVCDEQRDRSKASAEKTIRGTFKDAYENTAIGAKFCAAAIRARNAT